MKHLKTYENKKIEIEHAEKLKKIDFDTLSKKYKDHFFLSDVFMKEYNWKKEDFYIVLVNKIEPHNSPYPLNHLYNPRGDSFTVFENGKIKEPGGWGMSETEENFNNIHFILLFNIFPICIVVIEFGSIIGVRYCHITTKLCL